jgi:hypothetical protein
MPNKQGTRTIYRSAKTGQTVTKKYAESHPSTTVKERRPAPRHDRRRTPR